MKLAVYRAHGIAQGVERVASWLTVSSARVKCLPSFMGASEHGKGSQLAGSPASFASEGGGHRPGRIIVRVFNIKR